MGLRAPELKSRDFKPHETQIPGTLGTGARVSRILAARSRSMRHKSLGLLGLGQKSLGQSRDLELWDSSLVGREIFYVYL